jgi:hypothetical protein
MARKKPEAPSTYKLALQVLRDEPLLSQTDVAHLLGCSKQYIAQIAGAEPIVMAKRQHKRNAYLEKLRAQLMATQELKD